MPRPHHSADASRSSEPRCCLPSLVLPGKPSPPSPLHTSFWQLFPAPLPGVSSQPLPHPHCHQQKRPLRSSGPTRPECLRSTSLGFRHVLLPTTPGGRSPLAGRRGEASRDRPGSRPSSVAGRGPCCAALLRFAGTDERREARGVPRGRSDASQGPADCVRMGLPLFFNGFIRGI